MLLRPFRPADLQTLYEIDQACFPQGISYSREELRRFIQHKNSQTWVAEEEGQIAGFLVADRQAGKLGHIITVDVTERFRRRRVGTLLMDAAEDWFRTQGIAWVCLEAAETNTSAQRFYLARGYKQAEVIPGYYSDGSAAWVMVKWLGKSRPSTVDS